MVVLQILGIIAVCPLLTWLAFGSEALKQALKMLAEDALNMRGSHDKLSRSIIEKVDFYARLVRKEGFLAADPHIRPMPEGILRDGMRMFVDNTDPVVAEHILSEQIAEKRKQQRHLELGIAFESVLASASVTLVLGAFYGATVAALLAAFLLRIYLTHENALLRSEMEMHGVMGICYQTSPKIIENRLAKLAGIELPKPVPLVMPRRSYSKPIRPPMREDFSYENFSFDDLIFINDRGIQTVLREIPIETLKLALRTASKNITNLLLSNMSERAAENTLEQMHGTKAQLQDVEEAQIYMVMIARRLNEEGKIVIGKYEVDEQSDDENTEDDEIR